MENYKKFLEIYDLIEDYVYDSKNLQLYNDESITGLELNINEVIVHTITIHCGQTEHNSYNIKIEDILK